MPSFTSRPLAGPSDLALIADFVRAVRPVQRATDFPTAPDLPRLLGLPRNRETARLWFAADGHLLGFAFVDSFWTIRFDLDWGRSTPSLERAIFNWGNGCLIRETSSSEAPALLASCHEADRVRLDCLERQGFQPLEDHVIHMERPLARPVETARCPSGFTLRAVEGEHEAAVLASLHRTAFGTPHMTTERRLTMMRRPDYDPALDLVVLAADGTPAAYGMATLCPEENELSGQNACYTDLFATHPDYRGNGLARALLTALLVQMQLRGFALAKLSTGTDNLPMQRVAVAAGFHIASMTLRLARTGAGNNDPGHPV